MKFEIKHRYTGAVVFAAEITCEAEASIGVKLGLAVRAAISAHANLTDAYLTHANLTDAYLTGANLTGAKWTNGVAVNKLPMQVSGLPYFVTILDDHMQIGCELHRLSEWEAFDDELIARMDGCDARRFWSAWKAPLLSMARAAGRSFEPVQPQTEDAA